LHILANGLPLDFSIASANETGPKLVNYAFAAGAFVSILNPEWYAMTIERAHSPAEAGARAVEAHNYSSALDAGWVAASPPMIRMMSRPTVSAGRSWLLQTG
jgi:hypothetical protein